MSDPRFVTSIDDLINSVSEFYSKPQYWRAVVSQAPKYFLHIRNNGVDQFALSKFCAFKNALVEDYIGSNRYETNGTVTQKHIKRITNQDWLHRDNIDQETRTAFDKWILGYHNNYNLNNSHFISITPNQYIPASKTKFISPEELSKQLILNKKIGEVGKRIALRFEANRIKELGGKVSNINPEMVSTKNTAAGYDIYSECKKEKRFIEVKTSITDDEKFYISSNEVNTLEKLSKSAYIYFVHITDLDNEIGSVVKIINNPIQILKQNDLLNPILYSFSLMNI